MPKQSELQSDDTPVVCEFKPQVPAPDPFAGRGGTYELNLLTGERRPVAQPEEV